jgi:threonine/homoserine/homoserine lactone efflux protein
MAQLILDVLPFAIGVFASPLPVIITIVMLFTPNPRLTTMVYVVTWVCGLVAVTVLFTVLAGAFEGPGEASWLPWLRIVIGALLLAMGVKLWRGRAERRSPKWLTALLDSGPKQAVRYGILMSAANPKELLMALAAGVVLGSADASSTSVVVALVVFVAVGAASVAGPFLVFLAGGNRSLEFLETAREWLQRNNAVVAAVVFMALGLWLLLGGILKL